MSYEIKRKRYKKHIMELEFLRAELSLQEEILASAHQEFEHWYRDWCGKKNINLEELNKNHEKQISKILSQPNFSDLECDEAGLIIINQETTIQEKKKFTKLFKQVAKATHPDKHVGTALDFKTASRAYKIGDWSMLVQIAEKYKIFPDDFEELIPMMMDEAEKLREKIKQNTSMYSWKFQECATDECKEILVKQFLKHLFNLEL